MTLVASLLPVSIYVALFQTLIYLALPRRKRTTWAPLFTGVVGALIVGGAGYLFGFETIGLGGVPFVTLVAWTLATVAVVGSVGTLMLARPDTRATLADPRLADLSTGRASWQILFRIPVLTALVEEALFRGVLHAALIALYPSTMALWLGAGLFGLWHIGPGIDQAQASRSGGLGGVAHTLVTVVATTLAGAALVWLRMETGSIWVPVAVHAVMNMTMAVFARLAARPNSRAVKLLTNR